MISRAKKPFFLSPAFCAHNGVAVIASNGDEVTLGMLEYGNTELKRRIENAWPGIVFRYSQMSREEYALALSRLFSVDGDVQSASMENNSAASPIDRVENDAPIVNLLNTIFLEAVSLKASDVHIESESDCAVVRYRVDGRLRVMASLSPERGAALSARIKHLSNLNIIERRRPQDGRLDVAGLEYTLDVRVSIVPTVRGESIVLRLLNASDSPLLLDSLGFAPRELNGIREAMRKKSGLILVSGPTGSGKTTTLSAILRELKDDEIKIISIEDPVEYRLAGITQIQTDEVLDLSFESVMRRVFRQDPDIVMLGEIRDAESARLAVRAALTGHLVFATVHANGALETIPRLLNLGIEPYLLGGVLQLSVAQRLVRRLCVFCGGNGCVTCGGTGYSGRIAVSESVAINGEFRRSLESGYEPGKLEEIALRSGFIGMREDAATKISLGITDKREVLREIGA